MPHRMLLADDSVTTRRVIELAFAAEDIEVVVVGASAAMARVESERPDIVLADLGVPGPDGYELTAYLKGRPHLAHIPVVLLAGGARAD